MNKENINVSNKEYVDGNNKKEVMKELNKSYKATSIEIGNNEVDIRDLKKRDKDQLQFRHDNNKLAYLKFIAQSLNHLELLATAIVEKLYGENADKVVDDIVEARTKGLQAVIQEEEKN